MRVILFGATGMIGQGVLRECLLDPTVQSVLAIGRSPAGTRNPKLNELLLADMFDYSNVEDRLTGFDACFFCLGVSSTGMSEQDYHRITYEITVAAAQILSRLNPQMTFIFVSAAGADSSETGRIMWARVKGKTENAILGSPFAAAYVFRPGAVEPLHGIISRTTSYRILYSVFKPLLPLIRKALPNQILTTEQIGQAMLKIARRGYPKKILERSDIRAAALD